MPQDSASARATVTAGNFQRLGLDAFATGPLSDTVSYKLVGSANRQNGFVLNETTGNDVGGISRVFARGALRYVPGPDLDVTLSTDVMHERGTSAAHDTEYTANPPFPPLSDPTPFTTNAATDGKQDRDLFNTTLRAKYKLGWGDLASITGYRRNDYNMNFYFAGNPRTIDTVESLRTEIEHGREFSQEFRLSGTTGKLDWIGGLYYLDMSIDRLQSYDQWFDALYRALGLPQAAWSAGDGMIFFNETSKTNSYAGFGQLTYHLTERLRTTVGVRFTKDKLDSAVVATTSPVNAQPVGLSVRGGYSTGLLSSSWKATTPHFALEYQLHDDAMVYASVTKGYKSGAYNGTAATLADAQTPLEPEHVWSYEVGAKTEWLQKRLRVNLTGFYEDFTNLQIGTLIPGQAIIRANAAAIMRGAELEITAVPVVGLTVGANYSYLHNNYTDAAHAGKVVAHSPKSKLNLYASYDFHLGNSLQLTPHADWTYTGMFFMQPDNRTTEVQDGFSLLDVGLDLTTSGSEWRVSAYGKNLTDRLYKLAQTAVAVLGQDYVEYGAPRTYGISISKKF